jgi:isopenicillin-N N-acyltransferase-like protein
MRIKQSFCCLAFVSLAFASSLSSLRGPIESGAFASGSGIQPKSAAVSGAVDGQRVPKVLELSGSAYERGLKHGKELRPEITRMVELWKKDLQAQTKEAPDSLLRKFSAETNFVPAIKKWTPELLDEIKGIAEGSGQPYPTMLAYQLIDELWVYIDKGSEHHCSSLGVIRSGTHPAFVAQNMDLENFRDGSQVVLHITENPPQPEQFVFTSAGVIATNGMNNRKIAIACNTLMELSAAPEGLPVACVVRGVLAKTRGADVLEFVKTIKHASGQNYIIGVGDRVYDFEASANKVVEFRPVADGSVVYHTNHPLANDDWKPWHANKKQALKPEELNQDNSHVRLSALTSRLRKPASAIDEPVVKETLQSRDSKEHPICRTPADGMFFSFGATIMALSDEPYFQVTMGPPDRNKFLRLDFRSLGTASR